MLVEHLELRQSLNYFAVLIIGSAVIWVDRLNIDQMAETPEPRVLNVNVGVLGHVDSGKTSLGAPHQTSGGARCSSMLLQQHAVPPRQVQPCATQIACGL